MDMSTTPEPPTVRQRRHDPVGTVIAAITAVIATIVGILFLVWLVLFVTKGRFLKHPFERLASSYMDRRVAVAGDFNFYFDPIALRFKAEGMTVSNPAWASKPNLFSAKLIDTRIETAYFVLLGEKVLDWLTLTDGQIDAEWDAKHEHNTWTFAGSEPFKLPLIKQAVISGTTIRYRDPLKKLSADIAIDPIDARQNQVANNIRFSGGGAMRDIPFSIAGQQSTPNQLISGGENKFELHVRAAHSQVDVSGTLPAATQIEGADLAVGVRGRNLRELFDIAGIAVPDTRAYSLRSHMVKQGDEYRFTKIVGNYGNSDLEGALTVDMPPPARKDGRIKLTADLASRRVDMVDIGPFIGFEPNKLATQGAAAAATTQHAKGDYPRILPDAPLRTDALKAFDADVKYRVAVIKQPFIPISNILLGLNLDHSLLKLSPLNFDMAGGHVASDILIDSRVPAVITDYDIRMSPTPMGKLLARFGVADAGTTGTIKARIKMRGTGNTVRQSLATSNGRIAVILPAGTFWTKYVQLSEFDIGVFVQRLFQKKLKEPVQINCGLIGFTVRDGIATADPVLIDTSANVMTAKGGFSFKDESLALAFRADAKKISLFSAQSPVGINGHFAAPGIQIVTPQLLTRAGVSVGLGVLFPPAALAAFVDPGDAKAAKCGPVLAGANAAAQRTTKDQARKDVGTGQTGDVKAEQKHKKFLGIF
jgi:uncharacterized protein involved in outer membrane biogenesis